MKTAYIPLLIGFVLAASPALASTDPAAAPIPSRMIAALQNVPLPAPLLEQPRDETRETSLPLECRGFYLQQIAPRIEPLQLTLRAHG